ncbi:MAG: DUF6966 domain-containing protein [Myxococcota bacterium]
MNPLSFLSRLLRRPDRPIVPPGSAGDAESVAWTRSQELVQVLDELVVLLEADGEAHWSAWMRGARERIAANDLGGVHKVLGAYGGMGSFNDLIIGQSMTEGRLILADDVDALNTKLGGLRSAAYDLAQDVKVRVTAGA